VFDPLHRAVDLDQRALVRPLGFPLEVRSNRRDVVEAACETWGRSAPIFAEPPLELRVVVSPGIAEKPPPEPSFFAQRHISTIVADRLNFASIDSAQGIGLIWVTESTAADAGFFRWFFLEAAVYILLAERSLTPLHAGCVARAGRGVLLIGAGGAGKSTLAYGCARRGWSFIADDAVWLVRGESNRRVLAPPHRIRLLPDAARFFPELAERSITTSRNGKMYIEIALGDLQKFELASECEVAACVFLRRDGSTQPNLQLLEPEEAYARLTRDLVLYDAPARQEQLVSLRRLVEAPAFDLHYSAIEPAIDSLETVEQAIWRSAGVRR